MCSNAFLLVAGCNSASCWRCGLLVSLSLSQKASCEMDVGEIQSIANSSDMEKKRLLEDKRQQDTDSDISLTKAKQLLLVVTVLGIQFLCFCTDTTSYPFFPEVAKAKNLTNTQIGITFASFDITKFIVSPICGCLVRIYSKNIFYLCCSWVSLYHQSSTINKNNSE